ncbi:MAG: CinA family nicotinamide mononucleotide deamidase-related protein [Chloroflexi bacterium]|nr:CinA family nicotinamide mononucleotide deamidase-related protein [Chloroflexota bacterium]
MKAEIVTTGTEILLGEIVDTNAAYIARALRDAGVNLYYKTTVGDNRQRLAQVLRLGMSRSDVILVTGGLGPTVDDITREAVAEATGRPLKPRPELEAQLRAMYAAWGRTPTENNLRQTYLPEGAIALSNPIGTAPGFIVETERTAIICMPGVPREMKRMLADHVLPYLQAKMGGEKTVILARTVHTAGLGESDIDERIGHLMRAANPTVGLAAHLGRVDVRITARAATREGALALIAPVENEIKERLAPWVYGVDHETLGSVIAAQLRKREAKLTLVETNSQGRAASYFGQAEQDVLAETFHTLDYAKLEQRYGAPGPLGPDEISARRVALAASERTAADYVLALLGTAQPNQGFWSSERGHTWMAILTPHNFILKRLPIGGVDEFTANWLAVRSLMRLYKTIKSPQPTTQD